MRQIVAPESFFWAGENITVGFSEFWSAVWILEILGLTLVNKQDQFLNLKYLAEEVGIFQTDFTYHFSVKVSYMGKNMTFNNYQQVYY